MKKKLLIVFVLISVLGYSQIPVNPYFFYRQADIPALRAKMLQAPFASAYNSLQNGQGLKFALEGNAADSIASRDVYSMLLTERSRMVSGYPSFFAARFVLNYTSILDRTINLHNFTATEKNDLMVSCDNIAWRFRDLSYAPYNYDAGTVECVIATAFAGTFLFPNNPNAADHYNYAKSKINDILNVMVKSDGAFTMTPRYMFYSIIGSLTYFSKVERNYLGNNSGLISDPRYKSLLASYINFLTPPNVLNNNLRESPGVGNSGWGEGNYALLGAAAAEMKLIDTALAKRLQQAWIAAGSEFSGWFGLVSYTLINNDPSIIPDNQYVYGSKIFNKLGYYVFRNNYGTANESYLLSMLPSDQYTHSDFDCGSFSLYAYNTPLLLDAGVGNYDFVDVPYFNSTQMHNVVSFNWFDNSPVNGLQYGPTEVDSHLSGTYDYWRANITPNMYASKYYRSLGFLKDFSNTIVTYDYVESSYNSQNNLHIFSNATESTSVEDYTKTVSHCYNNIDIEIDHLLPGNPVQINKSRIGSLPGPWPNNLADANASRYQQWLIDKGVGDVQYLNIIRPKLANNLGTKTYIIVSSNSDVALYKVKEISTNKYFIIAVNKSNSTFNQTVNFNATVNLKDIRTNNVYQPSNGTIKVTVPFASFVVLIPETMPTQDTGPGISSTNPLTPTIVNPDPSNLDNLQIRTLGMDSTAPDSSARLEIISNNRGFLPPRLSKTQMEGIANPSDGLIVYCLDCPIKSLYFYDGAHWLPADGSTFPKKIGSPVATTSNPTFQIGSIFELKTTSGLWSGIPQPAITYQWQKNGINITGANDSTLSTTAVSNASYRCVVTASNVAGTASTITNTIIAYSSLPVCTQTPVIALQNSSAIITTPPVFTNAQSNITYQWLFNGNAINGANGTTLTNILQYYGGVLSLVVYTANNNGTVSISSNNLDMPKILDVVQAPAVAFSLRKLSSTYTGSAIKVRRSSDNATQNIGFANSNVVRTNLLPNPTLSGASVGTPGTLPNLWASSNNNGLSYAVVGAGNDISNTNQPYIDIAIFGTSTSAGIIFLNMPSVTYTSNETYTFSVGLKLQSGNLSGRLFLGALSFGNSNGEVFPTSNPMRFENITSNPSQGNSTIVYYVPSAGIVTNYTLRIYTPNVENAIGNITPLLTTGLQTVVETKIDVLDMNALTTFVGTSDGFVDTWYDQSGNGRDVFNASFDAQPKIVSAGNVETQNGKPAVLFSSSNQLLSANDATWLYNAPMSFLSVTKNLSGAGYIVGTEGGWGINILGLGIPNGFMKVQFFFNNGQFNDGQWGAPSNFAELNANPLITTLLFTAPGSKGYLNGTYINGANGPSGMGLNNSKRYTIGGAVSMSLFEEIHYVSSLTPINRGLIEGNQGAYYGISVLSSPY